MPTRVSTSSSRSRKAEATSSATAARETLSRWIAEKGLKATRQREIIVDTFFSSSGHLSVDELLAKVQSREERIGAATVYRTMKILADAGLASARHFEDVFDIIAAELEPKPSPQTYDRFLEALKIEAATAAMFEDLARNLAVPHALCMTTVLVVPTRTQEVFLEDWEREGRDAAHVDFLTENLAEFLEGVLAVGA